eukprot:356565-Chlamydomonas_euryale.AAC.9
MLLLPGRCRRSHPGRPRQQSMCSWTPWTSSARPSGPAKHPACHASPLLYLVLATPCIGTRHGMVHFQATRRSLHLPCLVCHLMEHFEALQQQQQQQQQ